MSFKIFSPGEKESWMNLNHQIHPRLFLSHPPPDYKVQVKKVKHKNSSKINNYKNQPRLKYQTPPQSHKTASNFNCNLKNDNLFG